MGALGRSQYWPLPPLIKLGDPGVRGPSLPAPQWRPPPLPSPYCELPSSYWEQTAPSWYGLGAVIPSQSVLGAPVLFRYGLGHPSPVYTGSRRLSPPAAGERGRVWPPFGPPGARPGSAAGIGVGKRPGNGRPRHRAVTGLPPPPGARPAASPSQVAAGGAQRSLSAPPSPTHLYPSIPLVHTGLHREGKATA